MTVPIHKPCKQIDGLISRVSGGEKRWLDMDAGRIYTWDSLHGELEVFNKRGKHIGVMDCGGHSIKPAVSGRRIHV